MKVSELKEYLEEFDDDCEVFIMSQPSWPFEHSIAGVVSRQDFISPGEPDESMEDWEKREERQREYRDNPWKDRWGASEDDLPQDDIFILEGPQLRYGSKNAWDCR